MSGADGQPYAYAFHGLRILSDIRLTELVELPAGAWDGEPDVTVRVGSVPPVSGGGAKFADGYHVGEHEILLDMPAAGRYLARAGNVVTVEPEASADPGAVQLFLIGSGLAAILHQRGLLPLHACAVEHGGECVAFLGDSGAGKSTLAAMLSRRGLRLVTDDVLVTRPHAGKGMLAEPSLPIMKLWPQSLDVAGLRMRRLNSRRSTTASIASPPRSASPAWPCR